MALDSSFNIFGEVRINDGCRMLGEKRKALGYPALQWSGGIDRVGHCITKDEAAEFVAKAPGLVRILFGAKTFSKFEEVLLLLPVRFDSQLDQFDQDAIVAQ